MPLTLIKELQAISKQGSLERKSKIDKYAKDAFKNACDDMKSAARCGWTKMTLHIRFGGGDSQYMHEVASRVDAMLVDKGIRRQGGTNLQNGTLGVVWDEE